LTHVNVNVNVNVYVNVHVPQSRLCVLALLAACGGAPPPVPPLALAHSPPLDLGSGPATAVVEQGDAVYALGGKIATVLRGGVITAKVEGDHAWVSGAVIAAPDGDGRWVIAVDDAGVPWRLTIAGEREQVADRLGLDGARVLAIGGAGTTFAAELADGVAFTTDGLHLTRVPTGAPGAQPTGARGAPGAQPTAAAGARPGPPAHALAVARDQLARAIAATATIPARVERWDLVRGTKQTYMLPASQLAFLDSDSDHPRLVVADGARVLIDRDGRLVPYAVPGSVTTIAARGDRLWIAAAGELWLFDNGKLRATHRDDRSASLLAATATGDAWLTSGHSLVRYAMGAASDDPRWQELVAPVFQRVCAHCHLPGGEAGIDLSTAASWHTDRSEIARRVLVTRTMPPAGTELNDVERAALEQWLAAK
jgi:hypothetical protein